MLLFVLFLRVAVSVKSPPSVSLRQRQNENLGLTVVVAAAKNRTPATTTITTTISNPLAIESDPQAAGASFYFWNFQQIRCSLFFQAKVALLLFNLFSLRFPKHRINNTSACGT
jgi:hypothetical protein